MGIRVCEEKKIFSISTPNTTYLMGVSGETCWAICITGKRMEDMDGYYLLRSGDERRRSIIILETSRIPGRFSL